MILRNYENDKLKCSASIASRAGTCSSKINLQLNKLIVDLRDRPHLSEELTMAMH